ncbi:hypothetical protein V3C33_21020 (plasmid) [Micrococcaceae bacterium Sec5.7]
MTNELFACDGRVDDEKMYELLGVGTETDTLDYKSTLDLSRGAEKQKIEFAKDCMAMMNLPTGGYLVIGVDGTGAPALDVAPIDRSHFDTRTRRVECPTWPTPRAMYEAGDHAGIWNCADLAVAGPPEPLTLVHAAVQDAAATIRRVIISVQARLQT